MTVLWMRFPLTATAVVLLAAPARAEGPPAAPAPAPSTLASLGPPEAPAPLEAPTPLEAPEAPPSNRASRNPLYVYGSFGINAVTYTGASGKAASSTVTPSNKVIQFEQAGFGYWVHPNVRVQLTGMFGETVSGLKPGQSSFTLGAVIPCIFYTNGGFSAGGGPLLAPRAFGTDGFNYGLFSVVSYGVRLGAGMMLALAVQAPVMVETKFSVAVTPALALSERF